MLDRLSAARHLPSLELREEEWAREVQDLAGVERLRRSEDVVGPPSSANKKHFLLITTIYPSSPHNYTFGQVVGPLRGHNRNCSRGDHIFCLDRSSSRLASEIFSLTHTLLVSPFSPSLSTSSS